MTAARGLQCHDVNPDGQQRQRRPVRQPARLNQGAERTTQLAALPPVNGFLRQAEVPLAAPANLDVGREAIRQLAFVVGEKIVSSLTASKEIPK